MVSYIRDSETLANPGGPILVCLFKILQDSLKVEPLSVFAEDFKRQKGSEYFLKRI
jgi:hypothetical protein